VAEGVGFEPTVTCATTVFKGDNSRIDTCQDMPSAPTLCVKSASPVPADAGQWPLIPSSMFAEMFADCCLASPVVSTQIEPSCQRVLQHGRSSVTRGST